MVDRGHSGRRLVVRRLQAVHGSAFLEARTVTVLPAVPWLRIPRHRWGLLIIRCHERVRCPLVREFRMVAVLG